MTTQTVRIEAHLVRDSHGNEQVFVVQDSNDTIFVSDLLDKDGERLYFESEAYHLSSWCGEHNLEHESYKEDLLLVFNI